MTGRPTKLTPERADLIINGIERGMSVEAVADLAGVHKATIFEWVNRGRDEIDRGGDPINPDDHTKTELIALAKEADLPTSGTKADLAERLNADTGLSPYADFSDRYARARGVLQWELLTEFLLAAKRSGDWRAYSWLLARKYPGEFGDQRTGEMTAGDVADDEQARAALERGKEIALKIEQASNVHKITRGDESAPSRRDTG